MPGFPKRHITRSPAVFAAGTMRLAGWSMTLDAYGKIESVVRTGQFADDISHEGFGIAEKHQSAIEVVERIIDAREARAHTAFHDHNGACLVDIQNRHSINGTAGFAARRGIGYVIGADHQGHIGLRE